MRVSFLERFRRQCQAAAREDQATILKLILDLENALAKPQEHRGLGLRKLHPAGIWEVRAGLSLRALFRFAEDAAVFLFMGTHDDVKRYLKTI